MKITTQKQDHHKFGSVCKPGRDTVSIIFTIKGDLPRTQKELANLAILGDVLNAGAGKLNRDEFIRAQDEIGSNIFVTIKDYSITLNVTTLKIHLSKTLKLVELMLKSPTLDKKEIKRAKVTISNLLKLEKDNARSIALGNLKNTFAKPGDSLYTIEPEVIIEAIKSVTEKSLRDTLKTTLAGTATITTGGDESINKIVLKTFSKLINKNAKAARSENKPLTLPSKTIVQIASVPSKQNIELSIGAPLNLTLKDNDLPAFIFGLTVLGKWGGFAGRLMSTVREKEGLTYTIYAKPEAITTEKFGYWRILTFFAPKDVKKGITSTLREINNIVENGITELELKQFKTIIKTSEALTYDSLDATTSAVHNSLLSGQDWSDYLAYKESLLACTRKEVNDALKKYLNPKALIISAAGPIKGVEKDLKSFSK